MTGHGIPFPGECRVANSPRRNARPWRGWLLAAFLTAPLPLLAGQTPDSRSSLTAAAGTSDVRIGTRNDTWASQWVQWDMRAGSGGLFARAERRTRDAGEGQLATLGGHWLGRRWIVAGQLEGGSGAAFVPHKAAQASLGYRLDRSHVIRLGYRQADYPGSTLRLWSISGLLYRGNNEWELGVRHGEVDTPAPQRIAFGLLRGQWSCSARWTCGVRLAAGRNVFGADEPGFNSGTGWQAGASLAYRLAGTDRLRLDLGTGHGRRFRQNAIMLSFRHALDH